MELDALRKFVAPEFVFGVGALSLAGRYVRNLGGSRVLLVTDPGVRRAGWADKVRAALDEEGLFSAVFEDVTPNPRDHEAMRGAEAFADHKCDCIVAVGGGSPMDCAKAVGIVHANSRHVLEFEGVDMVEHPAPPLVCVPTTAGTSADVSQFAIILDTERKTKISIVSKAVVPDAALIDPEATATMDPELTAATGLDALTHAVEAYVSNAGSHLTNILALEAVRLIAANLVHAIERPGDLEARTGMMQGSMLAGLAFSNAILGAVHAMAHSLGGFLDLPHGLCNAVLLPFVIARNYESAAGRYDEVGRAMGADMHGLDTPEERRDALLRAVRGLKEKSGVTATLSTMGVKTADLARLADMAVADPCMFTNPVELSAEDVTRIYEQAL